MSKRDSLYDQAANEGSEFVMPHIEARVCMEQTKFRWSLLHSFQYITMLPFYA